jgi:hypothetical protein
MRFPDYNTSKLDSQAFCSSLFNAINDYFEEKEEADIDPRTLPDYAFLKKIFLKAGNDEPRLNILFMIKQYVAEKGYQNLGDVVKELYDKVKSVKLTLRTQMEAFAQEDPTQKDELVKLMMCQFRQDPTYNGYFASADPVGSTGTIKHSSDANDTPTMAALRSNIQRIMDNDDPKNNRIQIIVRQFDHYTTLDIDKRSGSVFIIDAAGDTKQYNLFALLETNELVKQLYYVRTSEFLTDKGDKKQARMQYDTYSCSIFALDHSLQVARNLQLHKWLQANATCDNHGGANRYCVDWTQLDANMVRNAQSPTFRQHYAALHPESAAYLQEHDLTKTKHHFFSITDDVLVQNEQEVQTMVGQVDETVLNPPETMNEPHLKPAGRI